MFQIALIEMLFNTLATILLCNDVFSNNFKSVSKIDQSTECLLCLSLAIASQQKIKQ